MHARSTLSPATTAAATALRPCVASCPPESGLKPNCENNAKKTNNLIF
jgi:hypothetical protein